ncbi:hypothetical protein RI129_005659 [Pyrocoelia pectoralis]|uniref:CAP-Gly domain-containing protein n=1 Tax=Pyrocoelia pectoralis TaxID=417401 RepID=A0AAN7VIW6_9COLE
MGTIQEASDNSAVVIDDKPAIDNNVNNNEVAPDCDGAGSDANSNVNTECSIPKDLSERKTSVAQLKTSGMQSMSRIARPCTGHQKPAVPTTPTKHNSVLTEDTDSFIIGDKVWVGGTKPGQIAYIGETQFAPGEWAGIVLDQPIGKNDGSVSGVRYFQCEPKRGVFSRLTRLTRLPLPEAEEYVTIPINNGTRQRGGSPLSPTGSTRSLRKSPSLSASNTSLVSATHHVVDFKIGDRVIIKSTQGSKVGTLRFMGVTEFANGDWCGIELDEPRGKNDGSIEGIRYFDCRPQYGLFSPVTKVSKSPLKYKPGNCVIHSGAGLPPSGMKRVSSKESMLSMTSSIASTASNTRRVRLGVNSLTPQIVTPKTTANSFPSRTALQDLLREKQQHIEQLLKERDLENAEFTRAANHAEKVQQKLTTLKAEYEHYRSECESKLNEFTGALSQLNIDRQGLLSQLDDEKRRNEDLQFKFEEAAITKGDIEVVNQTNIQRIRDLENQLASERLKSDQLEAESGKLFEAEEALVKARDEIESLKSNLQQVMKKRDVLQVEHQTSTETEALLKQQLESAKAEIDNLQVERSKQIDELKMNVATSSSTKVEVEKELAEYKDKLKDHSSKCEMYQHEISVLKEQLSQMELQMTKKTIDSQTEENTLKAELDRLTDELHVKNKELQVKDEQLGAKTDEITSLKALLETSQIDLNAMSVDVERYQRSKQDVEIAFNKEIDYLKKTLKEKITEREEIEKSSNIKLTQKKAELEEATKTINNQANEIRLLKADLNEEKASLERNSIDVHERHTRQIAIKEAELMELASELQSKKEELTKCSIVTTKLEDDICAKNGIIDKLRLEMDSLRKQCDMDQISAAEYTKRITELQLNNGDLRRKLSSAEELGNELKEQKGRLEHELQSVIASSGDYSTELQKLNTTVIEKEKAIANMKDECNKKLQHSQGIEQQLQLQLKQADEDSQRIIATLEEKVKTALQGEQMLRDQCTNANVEAVKTREELMLKVNHLQGLVDEKDFALKVANSDHAENKRYLTEQLERTTGELQKTIESCKRKVDELSADNMNTRNAFTQKSQELIENEAKVQHLVSQFQMNEEDLRRGHEEQIKQMQLDLGEKSALVNQYQTELALLKTVCETRNINVVEKDHKISELSAQLTDDLKLIAQLQNDKDVLQLSQIEANKNWTTQNQQCTNLLNQVAVLTEKVELGQKFAHELEAQKSIHEQLLNALRLTEQEKRELIARLESEVNNNGDTEKYVYMLELAKNLQASSSNDYTRKIGELQNVLETTRLNLADSQMQIKTQKEDILRLQNEVLRLDKAPEPPTLRKQQLIEDKELEDGQIKFLNSIIVDMQKKNEEQRARIQLLESGYSAAAVNDLGLLEQPSKARAPRVYCDICEVFDDHETEDCPLQATDPDLELPPHRNKKSPPKDRAYCEICEIFGHCTEDCVEQDQTF